MGDVADDLVVADKGWVREAVACALKVSMPVARERLELATRLCDQFPETVATLTRGSISFWFAKYFADSVEVLTDQQASEVEARVLDRACTQTFGEFAGKEGDIIKQSEVDLTGNIYRQKLVDIARGAAKGSKDSLFADLDQRWGKAQAAVMK